MDYSAAGDVYLCTVCTIRAGLHLTLKNEENEKGQDRVG